MISLAAGSARLDLDPSNGGRLRSLSIAGFEVLVGPAAGRGPMAWGSYPLAPFGGRIRRGRFAFDGADYQLEPTLRPHAIHGMGYLQPWTIDDVGPGHAELSCAFTSDWPLGGHAHQRVELEPGRLHLTLAVAAGGQAMPAGLGWHPWFVKPEQLDFRAQAMYRRDDDGIAVAELVPVPPNPWDDCFTGVTQPVRLHWPGLTLALRSDCTDWVIYDEPDHATCVEPMSGPPDAFTLCPHRLEPGETLTRWFEMSW